MRSDKRNLGSTFTRSSVTSMALVLRADAEICRKDRYNLSLRVWELRIGANWGELERIGG